MFTRPVRTLRPPLAVPPRPGPAPRCSSHLPGLWVTRHQRGFTHVRPSGLPLACAPGWSGNASASSLSFAPRSYPRRTSGRGLALNTGQKLCHRHRRPSCLQAHSHHATSCRTFSSQSSARPAMAYTPASRTAGLSLPSCSAAVAKRSFRVRIRCSVRVLSNCSRCCSRVSAVFFSAAVICCSVLAFVERKPTTWTITVAIRVTMPTLPAMIAAMTDQGGAAWRRRSAVSSASGRSLWA